MTFFQKLDSKFEEILRSPYGRVGLICFLIGTFILSLWPCFWMLNQFSDILPILGIVIAVVSFLIHVWLVNKLTIQKFADEITKEMQDESGDNSRRATTNVTDNHGGV